MTCCPCGPAPPRARAWVSYPSPSTATAPCCQAAPLAPYSRSWAGVDTRDQENFYNYWVFLDTTSQIEGDERATQVLLCIYWIYVYVWVWSDWICAGAPPPNWRNIQLESTECGQKGQKGRKTSDLGWKWQGTSFCLNLAPAVSTMQCKQNIRAVYRTCKAANSQKLFQCKISKKEGMDSRGIHTNPT